MNTFGIIGLVYDIAGVLVLARALAFASERFLKVQSGTYYGFNSALLKFFVEQRIDARFGLATIIVGFLFQAIGAANIVASCAVSGALVLLLIIAVFLFEIFRRRLADALAKRLGDQILNERDENNER